MGLPITTIRKLLRQHCTGGQGIHLPDPTAEAAALEGMKQCLAGLPWARIAPCPYTRSNQRYIGLLQVDDPQSRQWGSSSPDEIAILVGETGRLLLSPRYWSSDDAMPVSSLDEIASLARAWREALEERAARAKRQDKIRNLKAQAIIARVRELAEEEGLEFHASANTQYLSLLVGMGTKEQESAEMVEVTIPFSKFEAKLPQLRQTLLALRQLHGLGVGFRVRQRGRLRHRSYTWTNRPHRS